MNRPSVLLRELYIQPQVPHFLDSVAVQGGHVTCFWLTTCSRSQGLDFWGRLWREGDFVQCPFPSRVTDRSAQATRADGWEETVDVSYSAASQDGQECFAK